MRLAATGSSVSLVATTLFCLSFLLQTSLAISVTSVVAANGDPVIHPDALVKVSWSAEAGDPPSFDINLRWPEGGIMLLRANVNLQDGSAVVSVRNVPAPQTCTIAITVNGRSVNTKSVSFSVVPAQPTTTELPAPGTNVQGSPTNAATTPQGPSPTSYPAVGTTTTMTDHISAPTIVANSASPSAFPTGNNSSSPSASASGSGKLITTISTDGGGHVTTEFINPTQASKPESSAASQAGSMKKSPTGTIVGAVIGGLAVLAFIVALAVSYMRRRRRRMAPSQMFKWLSGPDRELYESEMRQRNARANAPDGSTVNPPSAHSSINAWLGKIRPGPPET